MHKPTAFMDLVCPNDACPGYVLVLSTGRRLRFAWTARGTRYHNQGIYDDDQLACPECNTPGVEQGTIEPFLPEED